MENNVLLKKQRATIESRAVLLGILTAVSWVGMYLHNSMELPWLTLLSPENLGPALVSIFLIAGWLFTPFRRGFAFALLIWALLHFAVGGVLSVLPLPVWPFVPEQSVAHYLSHVIYAAAQLPLIVLLISLLRQKAAR
jgi:hypothetical protein